MNFIKKKVDSFSLNSFHPFKQFSVLLSETASYNIDVESGSYLSMQNYNSFVRSTSMYYLINQLFYKKNSPYYYSSDDNSQYWFKLLNSNFRVITLPKNLIGDGIKEGSVQISGSSNSILISDNYYGQLIDTSATGIVSSSDLVAFWSFDDAYKSDNTQYFKSINQRSTSSPIELYNVSFGTGIQNRMYSAIFNGNSYGRSVEYKEMDLEKSDDFALSFWINVPPSQSITTSSLNTVICKGSAYLNRWFFKVDTYNQTDSTNVRKLKVYRKDEYSESAITSSALTAGAFSHVVYQKTGSTFQLYVNNISQGTTSDNTNSDVYFKDKRDDFVLGGYVSSSQFDVKPEYSGSLDEIRFYNRALTSTEISNLYTNPYNTNIIGNVYYKHGILVLNNQSGSYSSLYTSATDTLRFSATSKTTEMKVEFTKDPGEFNFTLNPTVFNKTTNFENKQMISQVSSSFSDFSPYITTIGLMNEKSEILAVVKLKRPLKTNLDLPIKFVVRMDI